ncbi:MAG: glycoside hydrolase family 2 [Phycisphaerae bacterium]|nr:glycoside hydrolase family 2 [Phycisphaerae bacterium]
MRTTLLDGVWDLSYGPQQPAAPATPDELAASGWPSIDAAVPGNVELDLMKAGLLPELSFANNIHQTRAYEGHRWWYHRSFPSPETAAGERVELVFDGIDCVGTVFLNGQVVGRPCNMLIPHRFDVTALLRRGGAANHLHVRLDSAVLEGRKHVPGANEGAFVINWESLAVRKAPHMYGWDIMPRLVSAGLWRSVRLEIVPPVRFEDVYAATLSTNPANGKARLLVDWQFQVPVFDIDRWKFRLSLCRDGATVFTRSQPLVANHGRTLFDVGGVECWWPRGYGRQPLYDLVLEVVDETDAVLATHASRIGIRTVKLVRTTTTSHEAPGEFVFVVNDQPVFIKGTNWVPLDALHSRDKQHLAPAFDMLADLNCNMVRCWGGNVYEDDDFFAHCDRLGILVWQDFAMACALYPQTDEFAAVIRAEAETIIRKLRNHASLALWAGNNENDQGYIGGWFGVKFDPNLADRLSREVLPTAVRRLDPCREYLPSSPYFGPDLLKMPDRHEHTPEDHLWGPRDDFKGKFYTSSAAHFASEIGYHGCPGRRTMEQIVDKDHLWPWQDNDQWLTHATRPHVNVASFNYRIPLMAKQISVLFDRVPDNLDDYIAASQISQAEAKKFFIEWFRQGKMRRTGILWWNLRDGWPIISDAVVDYYNRRKLAYHYIKRVQADVCVICGEPADGTHPVLVVNDTLSAVSGSLTITDADSGKMLLETAFSVDINGRTIAGHIPASDRPAFWLISWTVNGRTFENHYLAGPRPFKLDGYKRWLARIGLVAGE